MPTKRKPAMKKPVKKLSPIDRFLALPDEKKARIADQYDAEFSVDKLMTRIGRPRKGQGFKVISTSFEKGLLDRLNAEAKRRGVPRAQLLAEFTEKGLAKVG